MDETVTEDQIKAAWLVIAKSKEWRYARLVLIGELMRAPTADLTSGAVMVEHGRRSFCRELLDLASEMAHVPGTVDFPTVNILREPRGQPSPIVGSRRRVGADHAGFPDRE